MKNSIAVKFLAILLCAFSVVVAIAGGAGIVVMESAGLYVSGLDGLQDQEYSSISRSVAISYAERYAADNLSNLTYSSKEDMYPDPLDRADAEYWAVKLQEGDQVLVDPGTVDKYSVVKEYTFTPEYVIISLQGPNDVPDNTTIPSAPTGAWPDTASESLPASGYRMSAYGDVTVPDGYLFYEQQTTWENGGLITYYLYYYEAPTYTVTVYMQPEVLESSYLHLLTSLYPNRYSFIAILVLGLLTFAVSLVYLFCTAGKNRDGEISPGGLNRLPLDLYGGIIGVAIWLLVMVFIYLLQWVGDEGPHPGNLSLLGVNLLAITLLVLAFLFAFAAQVKVKGGFWWRHSVLGFCILKLFRGIRFLWRGVQRLFRLLPVIWQWLLTALLMALGVLLCFILAWNGGDFFVILLFAAIILCICIVLYGGYCFGTLLFGVRRMNRGNLSHKIPTRYLAGSFLDLAEQLNALSETAMTAAQNQLRSERMKTELITNVSHDIKTPLTSIINFVDLLQKPHTPQQGEEYLEVLSRQSARMKRLIEDLMDLSKASTGNIQYNPVPLDAAEAVNQALGEFSDKLEAARLTPVFRHPDGSVMIKADGKLFWRVLSNLLSNAVKYAMPQTRLYVDLIQVDDTVLLSLKNVSREELRASAEELMERFVQGDTSRNAEGSGLGLNIAKSLMEVQHGQLQLLIDGDLFKVTLSFPAAH